jgi:hypothetical protein
MQGCSHYRLVIFFTYRFTTIIKSTRKIKLNVKENGIQNVTLNSFFIKLKSEIIKNDKKLPIKKIDRKTLRLIARKNNENTNNKGSNININFVIKGVLSLTIFTFLLFYFYY